MSDNLDTLRKTAEAEETQKWGGWAFEEDDFDGFCIYINDGDNFGRSYVAKDLTQGESEGESTAKFIATFDPPTVLALLSRLEQAEQAVARVRETHRPVDVEPSETICHACSTLRGNGDSLRYFPYKEWPCDTIRALDGDGRG